MADSIVLGIDLGTQQLKVTAVNCATVRVTGSVNAGIESLSESVGAVEQNPLHWWSKLCELTRRLIKETGIQPRQIAGIGLSGHMHSIVPLSTDLSPVYHSIVWADTRSSEQARYIDSLTNITHWNPAISAYSAPKIMWLRENKPEIFEKVHRILYPKDYLRFRMTGALSTDYSDASGSLTWDFASRDWDAVALSAIGLSSALFPQPQESSRTGGSLSQDAADQMGLVSGIPVAIGAGDVAAAVIGSGITSPNALLINAGTAAQVIVIQDAPEPYEYERGVRYLFELGIDGKVFTMGALPSAGLSLEWWRNTAGASLSYADLDKLAMQARSSADSVMFVPYLQGTGTPYLADQSLGTFVQMSSSTDIKAMTRAVMEGVALGIRLCAEALVADRTLDGLQVQITGGITKSALMRQLLATAFPGMVTFREVSDVSVIGAAALGAVAGGVVDHSSTFLSKFDFGSQQYPQEPSGSEHYETLYARFRHWAHAVVSNKSDMTG